MTCTEPTCSTEATMHLCEDHRLELADLLDNIPFLIVNLDPNIQATKVTKKPGGQEGGNGTKSAGSRPPTTDTNQLRYWLWELRGMNAYIEARDNERAGQTLHMARIWVGKARDAVYGPDREDVDHEANRAKVEEIAPPMPMRELLPWLRTNSRIAITSQAIRQWVSRGLLTPATRGQAATKGTPGIESTYHPHEVITAWHERNNR